jgi:hypothetical protein
MRQKKPTTEVMLQRQEFELRTLWWREWHRQATERTPEWRDANPPPEPKNINWNAPLPDGKHLEIDWSGLKNRG